MLEMICYYVTAIVAICISLFVYKGRNSRSNKVVLPPGSNGLPIIGETLQLLIPSYSLDLPPFIKTRIQRYGPIFRTGLVGRAVVVSADQDFNRYLVQQEGRLVELWYLDTFSKLFGQEGQVRTNATGYVHKYLRTITLNHFGIESLKQNLLPHIEIFVRESLHAWSTQESIDVKEAALIKLVEFAANQLFGYDAEHNEEKLGKKFAHFSQGLLSFPINIPGTSYHRCLKNHKEVMKILRDALKARMANTSNAYRGDFLDQILEDLKNKMFMTEELVLQTLFGLLFATSESTSMTLALAFKFLSENPPVMKELMEEHERIIHNREKSDSPLTWDEVRSMTFTIQVINECLRLGTVSLGILRKALKDIEFNGYTIPAGWTVMLIIAESNFNPKIFKNPLTFDPWRWQEMEAEVISKNFTPFGGGTRQCAGAEFSKVLLSIFLHVLLTKYRWERIKGGEIARNPFLVFRHGLHVKLALKKN